jgi:hypothetical protein
MHPERLDISGHAVFEQNRPQFAQRMPQHFVELRLAPSVVEVDDRAQDNAWRAEGCCIADERHRFVLPVAIPVVEALQRIDRGEAQAGVIENGAQVFSLRSVGKFSTGDAVADFDGFDSDRFR